MKTSHSLALSVILFFSQSSQAYWVDTFWVPDEDLYSPNYFVSVPIALVPFAPPLFNEYPEYYPYYYDNPYTYPYAPALVTGFLTGAAWQAYGWGGWHNGWNGYYWNNNWNRNWSHNTYNVTNNTTNVTNTSSATNTTNTNVTQTKKEEEQEAKDKLHQTDFRNEQADEERDRFAARQADEAHEYDEHRDVEASRVHHDTVVRNTYDIPHAHYAHQADIRLQGYSPPMRFSDRDFARPDFHESFGGFGHFGGGFGGFHGGGRR